jgi:hypothetical protein
MCPRRNTLLEMEVTMEDVSLLATLLSVPQRAVTAFNFSVLNVIVNSMLQLAAKYMAGWQSSECFSCVTTQSICIQ